MSSGIYSITNLTNGRRYVGSAGNIRSRWYAHRHALRHGAHHNVHLQRAWNRYGERSFVFAVLEFAPLGSLLSVEQQYLDANKDGYNIAMSATATGRGLTRSLEARKKMSVVHKGKAISPLHRAQISVALQGHAITYEMRAKMSVANRGQVRSPQTRKNISTALAGRTLSSEHCEAMRVAALGRKHSPETRAKISAALSGRKLSDSHREKIGALRRGKSIPAEQRAKMSVSHKRRHALRVKGVSSVVGY